MMQPGLRSTHRTPPSGSRRLDRVLGLAVAFRHRHHGHALQPKHRRGTTVVAHLGPFCWCSLTPRVLRPRPIPRGRQTTGSPDRHHVSLRRPANHRCLYKILLTSRYVRWPQNGFAHRRVLSRPIFIYAWERLELLLHASLPGAPNASVGVAEHIRGQPVRAL
jgi:hypothetical protein